MSLLQEALDAYAALTRIVKHLKYDKVAQALEITKLKKRVKKLEKGNKEVVDVVTAAKLITKVVTAASKMVIATSAIISAAEPKVLAATITAASVKLKAKEDPAVKRYQAMKRKPQTKAQARKDMMMYLKNVVGFKLDYFKWMS
nr:hypothetical protein [Tanacetum cinerariifolium]